MDKEEKFCSRVAWASVMDVEQETLFRQAKGGWGDFQPRRRLQRYYPWEPVGGIFFTDGGEIPFMVRLHYRTFVADFYTNEWQFGIGMS
jgi:hypothetical protein